MNNAGVFTRFLTRRFVITEDMLMQHDGVVVVPQDKRIDYDLLSIDCIRKFKDTLDWARLTYSQKWTGDMIWEFRDKIVFGALEDHRCLLSEEYVRALQSKLTWGWISRNGILSESYIREYKDRLDWRYITGVHEMSESFMREHVDFLDWDRINVAAMSQSFRDDYDDRIVWTYAFIDCYLDIGYVQRYISRANWNDIWFEIQTEEFVRTFISYVDWEMVWESDLSEQFIREYMHMIVDPDEYELLDPTPFDCFWYPVSKKSLTEAFIREYGNNLAWDSVCQFSQLSETLIRDYADKVDWKAISKYQSMSLPFMHEHKLKLTMCPNIRNLIRRERGTLEVQKIVTLPLEMMRVIGEYL